MPWQKGRRRPTPPAVLSGHNAIAKGPMDQARLDLYPLISEKHLTKPQREAVTELCKRRLHLYP